MLNYKDLSFYVMVLVKGSTL